MQVDIHDNIDLSDSDDDLLGISDNPILIRTINHPEFHSKQLSHQKYYTKDKFNSNQSKYTPQNQPNFYPKISSKTLLSKPDYHSDNGWFHYKKGKKYKSPSSSNNTSIVSNSHYKPHILSPDHKNYNIDKSPFDPSTQQININLLNNNSTNPDKTIPLYQHLNSTSNQIQTQSKSDIHINTESEIESLIRQKIGFLGVNNNNNNNKDINMNLSKYKSPESKSEDNFLSINNMPETSLPTMEIIDINNYKIDPKQNRYQRMREIHNIIGFIVNVHDATNFDIDLEIPPELHEKYRDVISNQYTYQDLDSDFLENRDLNKRTQIEPTIGTTYRCRLRGVGISQLSSNIHTWKSNQMCVEVKQLIDRTDGWITCTLSDIDVYQRLLVDIVIHTCNGPINLRDYLLSRMEGEENPIFYPYSGKRDRKYINYNDS
jgi:hypothetical protein